MNYESAYKVLPSGWNTQGAFWSAAILPQIEQGSSLVHCEGFGVLQVDPCRYGSGIGGPEFKVSTGSMLMQPNVAPAEGTDYETNTDEI